MKSGKAAVIVGGYVLVAVALFVVFYMVGKSTVEEGTWADQHINRSRDPKEFRNRFLGLTVRAPAEGDWWLLWKPRVSDEWREPEFKMPTPEGCNKVLEIERQLSRASSDKQWARMDLFVEPLYSSGQAGQILRKIQLRRLRRNLQLDAPEKVTIGGKLGSVRTGNWSVADKRFCLVVYSVEHRQKLFVFSGVTPADAFERFLPVFNEIVASVRLR